MNKFLLAGDEFMPEMPLRQPKFSDSTCGLFGKNKERIKKLRKTGDSTYSFQKELDKSCFQHDMSYGNFTDLPRKAAADKFLCDKAFNIAKNYRYDVYQRGLASMVNKILDKKTLGIAVKNEIIKNKELFGKLRKPIIEKFEK